jgi:hypothetical protein
VHRVEEMEEGGVLTWRKRGGVNVGEGEKNETMRQFQSNVILRKLKPKS